MQASWSELERGSDGAFTLQLILDHGAEEYVLRPTAQDVTALLELAARRGATFDLDRRVLIFGAVPLPG